VDKIARIDKRETVSILPLIIALLGGKVKERGRSPHLGSQVASA